MLLQIGPHLINTRSLDNPRKYTIHKGRTIVEQWSLINNLWVDTTAIARKEQKIAFLKAEMAAVAEQLRLRQAYELQLASTR